MESAYERAIADVNQNSLFQKKFDVIYNGVFMSLWAMAYMNIFLVLVVIPHQCKIPVKPNNVSDDYWKRIYLPEDKNSDGVFKLSSCLVYIDKNNNNDTKACEDYDYDTTWYGSTVTSDNDWVCDNEIYVANVFAYTRISETFGSLFFGWFGDMYGRRLTYISSVAFIILGRVMSVIGGHSFFWFVTGCVLASFPSWSSMQSLTVISVEISSPERRSTTATLRFMSWSIGVCIMPFLYWWLREWKIFMIVTTVGLFPFLLFSWSLIESPRWLWTKGRGKDCINQLHKIAKENKTVLHQDCADQLMTTLKLGEAPSFGPLALFSHWRLGVNTILQLLWWIFVSITYTVLVMNSGEANDGNPFLNFAWQSLAEVPGSLLGGWMVNNCGRRKTGAVAFGMSGAMWLLMSLQENSYLSWMRLVWFVTTISMINRLFISIAYFTINLFNMELFPTCVRQSGMSLGNVVSSGASAIAPYVMFLGHNVDARLPGVILAAVSFTGVLTSLLLPETLNKKLPETLEEAQKFGKHQYFSLKTFKSTKKIQEDMLGS